MPTLRELNKGKHICKHMKQAESIRTKWDHIGPKGTIQDHTGPYGTIWDHSGLFHASGAVPNFFVTHRLTDSLTDSLTHSQVRFLEGHAPLKMVKI